MGSKGRLALFRLEPNVPASKTRMEEGSSAPISGKLKGACPPSVICVSIRPGWAWSPDRAGQRQPIVNRGGCYGENSRSDGVVGDGGSGFGLCRL